MIASDQMFATREDGVPDPLRYDGHVGAPQEVAPMLADPEC
jgi:hypothetical protein